MHGTGLIGYGIQGRRMAATLRQHRAFAIRAVWDPDADARAAAAAETPGIATPPDPSAVFADPAIAVIYIASPPASHLLHVGRALDAGKAVFCEKPLATDRHAAAAMVARVEGEGARAAVNFSLAHAPAFLAAAEAFAAGATGTPRSVAIDVAFREWPRPWQRDAARWLAGAAEGGFTREVVSHFVWVTRRLLGPLAVRSASVRRPAEDAAESALSATFAAGAVTGTVSGTVGPGVTEDDVNSWTLEGDAGALRIFDWYRFARRGEAGWVESDLGAAEDRRERSRMAQLDALAAMIEGRPHGLPSLREALDVQLAVEAMLAGA
ncbi:MAG: Gfo/Idh/MocA family oxidoreductase [Alphaproteobacteria bacterium]|nr:Gfo/Idh/MocA family oxidoreductase [Alphaproteobacteria bacterium]